MRELLHEIRERRSSIRIKTLKQIQKCLEINPRINSVSVSQRRLCTNAKALIIRKLIGKNLI